MTDFCLLRKSDQGFGSIKYEYKGIKITIGVLMKKLLPGIIILVLTLSIFGLTKVARSAANDPMTKIAPELQVQLASLQPGQMITVIVTLKDQYRPEPGALQNLPNRQKVLIEALQAHSHNSQQAISAALGAAQAQGRVGGVIPFWVFNGLSITATGDVIQELAN